jgi:hypothetical protein
MNAKLVIAVLLLFIVIYMYYKNNDTEEFEEGVSDEVRGILSSGDDSFMQLEPSHEKTEEPKPYKRFSYVEGDRGTVGEWTGAFGKPVFSVNDEHPIMPDKHNGNFAKYATDKKFQLPEEKTIDPEDIYNADNYLPKEKNDKWFEVIDVPIDINDKNLTAVFRQVGFTATQSNKNANYQIRADPPITKKTVGPFLYSAIEPEMYSTGLCA